MTALPDRGLSRIATSLRNLARLDSLHPHAEKLRDHAAQLDRADRELRHLRGLASRLQGAPELHDLTWLRDTHEHWMREQAEIDAEIASGA